MNPFDQFVVKPNEAFPPPQQQPMVGDVNIVAPQQQQPPPPHLQQQQNPQQFNLMAPPATERKPIMNIPGMMPPQQQPMMYGQQQPPPSHSGMMYGVGQQPPPSQGMFFGGPPPPQQQQQPPPPQWSSGGFGGMTGQQQTSGTMSMAGALVPSGMQSNPYALGPADNPFGPPSFPPLQQPQQPHQQIQPPMPFQQQQQQQQQQPVPMQQSADPFGLDSSPMHPQQQQHQQHQQPQFGTTSIGLMDPFGVAPPLVSQQQPPPQQQQLAIDPWGGGVGGGGFEGIQQQQSSMAIVPASMPSDDPFGIFGGGGGGFSGGASATLGGGGVGVPPPIVPVNDDPWADMGFGPSSASSAPPTPAPTGPIPGVDDDLFNATLQPTREDESKPPQPTSSSSSSPRKDGSKRKKGELPPGGEWYDAKIFTPTLGVMFFKPKELVDSLFLQTDKKLVDALDERPVVAFIVEGSSARSAGVELGHVLLKVNGIDVKNPKEASRLIKEGPRPLPLLFYVPETSVVVAEGEHMVKYNTKDTTAPNSAKDWKPKYVVVGGIIAQPWIMNMYKSKSEYDIAVIETQARRPISVKVKQFSLQGARIQNDWQGPQMVKYKNKLHPWKYIVVLPVARNPIKIGAPNLSQLKPVHEGIRRVLQAQLNRAGGGGHVVAGPVVGPSDPYRSGGGGAGGVYDGREHNGHNSHRDHAGHGY